MQAFRQHCIHSGLNPTNLDFSPILADTASHLPFSFVLCTSISQRDRPQVSFPFLISTLLSRPQKLSRSTSLRTAAASIGLIGIQAVQWPISCKTLKDTLSFRASVCRFPKCIILECIHLTSSTSLHFKRSSHRYRDCLLVWLHFLTPTSGSLRYGCSTVR